MNATQQNSKQKISTKAVAWLSLAVGTCVFLPQKLFGATLQNAPGFLGKTANTATGKDGAPEIETVLGGFIQTALSLIGIIFLILMIYAGYLWLTAQGEDAQIDKSKKIIKSTMIGLFLVVSAFAITQFILGATGG